MKRLLCGFLLVLQLCGGGQSAPAFGSDNTAAPAGRVASEICFPMSDAEGLLRDAEGVRKARNEADACRTWQQEHLEADQVRAEVCTATAARLDNVVVERDEAIRQAEKNLKAGTGTWWDGVKVRVTWAGIGAAVLYAGKILILGGL